METRYYRSGIGPLSRRSVLGRLLAAAGIAGCSMRTVRSENTAAAVDDSTRLADLGMQLDAQQRADLIAFAASRAHADLPVVQYQLGTLLARTSRLDEAAFVPREVGPLGVARDQG